jgi:hypothetical protein
MIPNQLIIAAALACNFLLTMAAPTVLDDRCPKAKVKICDSTDFRGDCKTVEVELDTCGAFSASN